MILMELPPQPDGSVPLRRVVLKSGAVLRPDPESGRLYVATPDEMSELLGEGWRVVKGSLDGEIVTRIFNAESARNGLVKRYSNVADLELKRRGDAAAFRKQAGYSPARSRIVIGEVDVGAPHGRVHIEHDLLDHGLMISGVNVALDDVDADLRRAFRAASGSFIDNLEDQEFQTTVRTTIGAIVAAIMNRHPNIEDAVRQASQSTTGLVSARTMASDWSLPSSRASVVLDFMRVQHHHLFTAKVFLAEPWT